CARHPYYDSGWFAYW
nr:immunoglobulin heavy chain junction region [Mus musculus]